MSSNKSIVIIDINSSRTDTLLNRLIKENVKVKIAHNKGQLDAVARNEGIRALLVSSQVAGDIPKLKELYRVPIFVVGDLTIPQLEKICKLDIDDVFPEDFEVQLLFNKLGQVWIAPEKVQPKNNNVFQNRTNLNHSNSKAPTHAEEKKKNLFSVLNRPIRLGKKDYA